MGNRALHGAIPTRRCGTTASIRFAASGAATVSFKFYARLTVKEADGRKKNQWALLLTTTPAEAQAELRTLLVERDQNNLRQLSRSPVFTDYLNKTCLPLLATSGKNPPPTSPRKPTTNGGTPPWASCTSYPG